MYGSGYGHGLEETGVQVGVGLRKHMMETYITGPNGSDVRLCTRVLAANRGRVRARLRPGLGLELAQTLGLARTRTRTRTRTKG